MSSHLAPEMWSTRKVRSNYTPDTTQKKNAFFIRVAESLDVRSLVSLCSTQAVGHPLGTLSMAVATPLQKLLTAPRSIWIP